MACDVSPVAMFFPSSSTISIITLKLFLDFTLCGLVSLRVSLEAPLEVSLKVSLNVSLEISLKVSLQTAHLWLSADLDSSSLAVRLNISLLTICQNDSVNQKVTQFHHLSTYAPFTPISDEKKWKCVLV